MISAIPASQIVQVIPGVIGAGGDALDLSGLFLTASARMPVGVALSFPSAATVASYFGSTSPEAIKAGVYFQGFDNSTAKPGAVFFYLHNPGGKVAAFLRGGSLAAMSLAQLQAVPNGTLTITIDGAPHTSGTINLSGATSFSNAATLIQTALAASDAVFTGSVAVTTGVLTVTAVASGVIANGQRFTGTGVPASGNVIGNQLTGPAGGTGTYNTNLTVAVASTTMTAGAPTITFDSIASAFLITSGSNGASTSNIAFATGPMAVSLLLDSASGGIVSQGADAATPAGTMNAVTALTTNFATFGTIDEMTTGDKVLFAAWNATQNNRFLYVCRDSDPNALLAAQTTTAGYLIGAAGSSGTELIWSPTDLNHVAFVMGCVASIDFTAHNGRVNLAFRTQSGLVPGVTSGAQSAQLLLNGYNFYGTYATANQNLNFLYNGSCFGPFLWADDYVNQIWLNNALQLALIEMLTQFKAVPYNALGKAFIDAACADPINAAVNFGMIQPGVILSAAQTAEVNAAANLPIATVIQNRGWYLLVGDASAQVRAARGSPPITLFYTSGGSVNKITLASIEVE